MGLSWVGARRCFRREFAGHVERDGDKLGRMQLLPPGFQVRGGVGVGLSWVLAPGFQVRGHVGWDLAELGWSCMLVLVQDVGCA